MSTIKSSTEHLTLNADGAGKEIKFQANGVEVARIDANGWVGAGGGASTLPALTDVTITAVANNDLLMYNSVAAQWQNTNLGVSVTPTLTGDASGFSASPYTLTVSNHATYDDPSYLVEVYTGATLVVADSAVTDNGDGTFTFVAPSTGTHEIRVICQDFGDLQSEVATKALTTTEFSATGRYWRIKDFSSTSSTMIADISLFSASSQAGTKYPTNMTSNVLPTPFVASGTGAYNATYDYFKPFDGGAGQYWNLGSGAPATDYVAIDLGSAVTIRSMSIKSGTVTAYVGPVTLYYATTSDFSDEVAVRTFEFTVQNEVITFG